MLLEDFMPMYDFNEVHAIVISATPNRIFRAIREVTPQEVQLIQTLFKIRSLPALIMGKGKTMFHGTTMFTNEPLLDQFLKYGFSMLNENPDLEMVFGHIGQSWKFQGAQPYEISDTQDFLNFDRPDYLKIAMNFHVDTYSNIGETKLSTETRIIATDSAARKKFAIYWRFIYPGSALIRRMWLRAIKRRAKQD